MFICVLFRHVSPDRVVTSCSFVFYFVMCHPDRVVVTACSFVFYFVKHLVLGRPLFRCPSVIPLIFFQSTTRELCHLKISGFKTDVLSEMLHIVLIKYV